jgi:Flp pilus assembly protein TadG
MSNPMTALIARLRRFIKRREGNTAIIFGLAAIPVVVAAGMAVDVTRAYMVKERLSAALDAASLAAASEGSLNQAQMLTKLQQYFLANYPSTALGYNITVTPLDTNADPNGSVSAQVVNYQAQATVDMSFMSLVGVSNITVTALAQTHRGFGLEIALVLDNTGSMLCGPNDGAPNYNNAACSGSVNSGDTNCTDTSDLSRICQLRQASLQFLNILTSANPGPSQLYISVVPYVTTVNIAALCNNQQFNCGNVTAGPTAANTCATSDFTDQYGFIVDAPFTVWGTVSKVGSGSSALGEVTVTSGSLSNVAAQMVIEQLYTAPNVSNNNSVWDPMLTGNVVPAGATIQAVGVAGGLGANQFTFSPAPTSTSGTPVLIQFGFTGNVNSSASVTGVSNAVATVLANPSTLPGSPALANAWTVSDSLAVDATTTIPAGTGARENPERATTISSVSVGSGTGSTSTVTLCQAATASASNQIIMLYNPIWFDSSANSFPLASSSAATNPGSAQWMGCVIEVTSGDEMTGGTGALAFNGVTDPDENEPSLSENFYPFWWMPGDVNNGTTGLNNWIGGNNFNASTGNSIVAQTNLNPGGEILGTVTTDWDSFPGPNQGCPVPILPLTDVTSANPNGPAAVQNTINQMWPRDAGGTQVGIGMIWGWRVLSANGPFPPNNGHPLTYAQESSQVWKKVVVLMTDGTEEWPSADQLTGEGFLQDGKLNTTNNTNTAITSIDNRLASVCTNMALTGNYVIYTIGLGSDGQQNTQLQTCATGQGNIAGVNNGGFFTPATPANLTAAFQSIAQSILTLRLSQ